MIFNDNRPIYLQIGEWICNKILTGEWSEEERIPSVRELGAHLMVNPNTVMRAYERLQSQGVLYNRRGIGFYVAASAKTIVLSEKRQQFLQEDLPALFARMRLLSVTIDQLQQHHLHYLSTHQPDKSNCHENASNKML